MTLGDGNQWATSAAQHPDTFGKPYRTLALTQELVFFVTLVAGTRTQQSSCEDLNGHASVATYSPLS